MLLWQLFVFSKCKLTVRLRYKLFISFLFVHNLFSYMDSEQLFLIQMATVYIQK